LKEQEKEKAKDDAQRSQPTTPPELTAAGQTTPGADSVDRGTLLEALISTLGSLNSGSSASPTVSVVEDNTSVSRQRMLENLIRSQSAMMFDWYAMMTDQQETTLPVVQPRPPTPTTPPPRDLSTSPWRTQS